MDKTRYDNIETQYFSLSDILALGLMIATGLYFILTSILKISVMVFGTMDLFNLLMNIIGGLVGFGLIFGAYKYVKRSTFLKTIADSIFLEALYDRLEPMLEDIAETRASYDSLIDEVDRLKYGVDDIRKSIELGKTNPSDDLMPMQFAMKRIIHQFQYTMLAIITLAIYMFMFYNPSSVVPYTSPLVYVLWWALLTSHNNLWEVTKSWYWLAVPILIIPMFTILFTALYKVNLTLFIMYIGLGLYIILYYIWCEYTARGIIPFGIGERLHQMKTLLKKEEVKEEKPPAKKEFVFRPSHFGIIMIIFSIIVFIISLAAYLIESQLIEISWEMLGLDISWQPLYSYGMIVLGILMLAAGYIFVVKSRGYE